MRLHNQARLVASVIGLAALTHCAHASDDGRLGAAPLKPVLATFGAQTLAEAELPEAIRQRLTRLDDAYLQERFNVIWAGLEDSVGQQLLAAQAARERMPLAAYLAREIDAKVGEPSPQEIRGLYDANQALIARPFAEVASELRAHYLKLRRQALLRGVIDALRAQSHVALKLVPPTLSRQTVPGDGPSLGPSRAPLTLVVFSDFACPYSAQGRRLAKRLVELYGDQLRIVHRYLPLEHHANAKPAAKMAICAAEQHKFWSFAELLWENGTRLGPDGLRAYAHAAELNDETLGRCLRSERPQAVLNADLEAASALGIEGTPAMVLEGMYIRGVVPLPVMRAYIDRELGRRNLPLPEPHEELPAGEIPADFPLEGESPAAGPQPFDVLEHP